MSEQLSVTPPAITVVIPTLNEARNLRKTILHTKAQSTEPKAIHFIVVDAGSEDGTLETVSDLQVEVITRPELKAQKYASLNVGLEKSKSPITLFLDADTHLPKGFDTLVLQTLKNDSVVAGAFEMTFDRMNWRLFVVRLVNRVRYRIEKLYYGDQAIFCRTETAKRIGGVPNEPLMEAAYFCRALKPQGKLRLVKPAVITSPRRFERHGIWKVFWFDVHMWLRFTIGRDISRFAKDYWDDHVAIKPPPAP